MNFSAPPRIFVEPIAKLATVKLSSISESSARFGPCSVSYFRRRANSHAETGGQDEYDPRRGRHWPVCEVLSTAHRCGSSTERSSSCPSSVARLHLRQPSLLPRDCTVVFQKLGAEHRGPVRIARCQPTSEVTRMRSRKWKRERMMRRVQEGRHEVLAEVTWTAMKRLRPSGGEGEEGDLKRGRHTDCRCLEFVVVADQQHDCARSSDPCLAAWLSDVNLLIDGVRLINAEAGMHGA